MLKSYVQLRKSVGFLGMLLPVLLFLGNQTGGFNPIGESISSYAWANDHVIFSMILGICGSFLIFYEGYDKGDNRATNLAGWCFIGIAIFPCLGGSEYTLLFIPPKVTNIIHGTLATIGFTTLGYISYFRFTKISADKYVTNRKLSRNKLYKICGIVIFSTIGALFLLSVIPGLRESTDKFGLFFLLEAVILEAFGVSWTVKGKVFLKDYSE